MTIEITRGAFLTSYKVNEYCATELLERRNKRGQRWTVHSRHATPEEATATLLKLERESKAVTK